MAGKPLSRLESELLDALEKGGPRGILGVDLSDHSWRFGAAIFTLRQRGFRIESRPITKHTWVYTLEKYLTKPMRQRSLFDG